MHADSHYLISSIYDEDREEFILMYEPELAHELMQPHVRRAMELGFNCVKTHWYDETLEQDVVVFERYTA